MKAPRGFIAIEMLIAIVILSVFVALAATVVMDQSMQDKRAVVAREYLKEWPVLVRAVRVFVRSRAASFPPDAVRFIDLAELTNTGLLPASFATRATGAGTTPLGHAYRIAAIRSGTDNKTRTVIWESGTAHVGRLASLDYPTDEGAPVDFKRHVASDLASAGLTAAYLQAGVASARDPGSNGWTKDVSAWVPAAGLQNGVAVLLGFPDLEAEGGDDGGSGGAVALGKCRVVGPTCSSGQNPCPSPGFVIPASVPAGRTEEGRWPHCIDSNDDTFYPVAKNSAVITLGMVEASARTWTDDDCKDMAEQNGGPIGSPGYLNFFAQCANARETNSHTNVYLNNGLQGSNLCSLTGYHLQGCGTKQCVRQWAVVQARQNPTTDDIFACEPSGS